MHPLKALRALYDNLIAELKEIRKAIGGQSTPTPTPVVLPSDDLAAIRKAVEFLAALERQRQMAQFGHCNLS